MYRRVAGDCIGCIATTKTLTQSKLPWVVLLSPAPGVWAADWLWQNPAAGYRAQTLMSHPRATSRDHAAVCSFQAPASRLGFNNIYFTGAPAFSRYLLGVS